MTVSFFVKMLNPIVSVTLYRYGKQLTRANAADLLDSSYADAEIIGWDFSFHPLRIFLL